jgi:hypothetical protein
MTLEAFRQRVKGRKSLLGEAAGGTSWDSYRVALAFAGVATLKLTREHGVQRWLEFCAVNQDALAQFALDREWQFPSKLFAPEPVAAAPDEDLLDRTARNFVTFIEKVERIHRDNVAKTRAAEQMQSAKPPRPRAETHHTCCVDSEFAKAGAFVVAMPVCVGDAMDEDDDKDEDYVEVEGEDEDEFEYCELAISERVVAALEADAKVRAECFAQEFSPHASDEEKVQKKQAGKKRARPKPARACSGPSWARDSTGHQLGWAICHGGPQERRRRVD